MTAQHTALIHFRHLSLAVERDLVCLQQSEFCLCWCCLGKPRISFCPRMSGTRGTAKVESPSTYRRSTVTKAVQTFRYGGDTCAAYW